MSDPRVTVSMVRELRGLWWCIAQEAQLEPESVSSISLKFGQPEFKGKYGHRGKIEFRGTIEFVCDEAVLLGALAEVDSDAV